MAGRCGIVCVPYRLAPGKEEMIKMASQKYTILYGRLSQEDARLGDSNSIVNQEDICQGYFHPKNAMFPFP